MAIPLAEMFPTVDALADFLLLPQDQQDKILLERAGESATARAMLSCDLRRRGCSCVNPLENPQLQELQTEERVIEEKGRQRGFTQLPINFGQ
jgi:hypothetical protein